MHHSNTLAFPAWAAQSVVIKNSLNPLPNWNSHPKKQALTINHLKMRTALRHPRSPRSATSSSLRRIYAVGSVPFLGHSSTRTFRSAVSTMMSIVQQIVSLFRLQRVPVFSAFSAPLEVAAPEVGRTPVASLRPRNRRSPQAPSPASQR